MPPHPVNCFWFFFLVFLVETGFQHVHQVDLKPLTSSDLPALASQNPGITDVSHHTWLILLVTFISIYVFIY